jgi:hypothetical protein
MLRRGEEEKVRRLTAILPVMILAGILFMAYAGDDAAPADPSDEETCCCDCQVEGCTGDCDDCDASDCEDENHECTCSATDEEGCPCGGEIEDCTEDCTDCEASDCGEAAPDCGCGHHGSEPTEDSGHCGGCH